MMSDGGLSAVSVWVVVTVGGAILGISALVAFIGALTGRVSPSLGAAAGAALGVVALFPGGCVTRTDPTSLTKCHTLYGLPIPNEIVGLIGAISLGAILSMTAAYVGGRRSR